jgi:hypothetical protein
MLPWWLTLEQQFLFEGHTLHTANVPTDVGLARIPADSGLGVERSAITRRAVGTRLTRSRVYPWGYISPDALRFSSTAEHEFRRGQPR